MQPGATAAAAAAAAKAAAAAIVGAGLGDQLATAVAAAAAVARHGVISNGHRVLAGAVGDGGEVGGLVGVAEGRMWVRHQRGELCLGFG